MNLEMFGWLKKTLLAESQIYIYIYKGTMLVTNWNKNRTFILLEI